MSKRGWLTGFALVSFGILLGSLWGAGGFRVNAAVPQEDGKADADLEAIKAAADQYTAAFNAQDAAAIARLLTEEAEFVDGRDNVVHGKKAIEDAFTEFFKNNPKNKLVIDMDVLRRISPATVIEEGTYSFQGGNGAAASVDRSHYVLLHVKQNGGWKIASIRTDRDADASGGDELKQLAWLEGSWVDEGADEVIRSTWKWSEDGNYLLGHFSVESKGRLVMKGTQRLAWDGNRKQIRSWVFDSEGGYVEGFWHKLANGSWLVKGSGVNSEGETTSQTTVYTPKTKDRFELTMRDRITGDEVLPDIVVTIVRAASAPKE